MSGATECLATWSSAASRDRMTDRPFDIGLPEGLERMGLITGTTGSGKTSTIGRLEEAALAVRPAGRF